MKDSLETLLCRRLVEWTVCITLLSCGAPVPEAAGGRDGLRRIFQGPFESVQVTGEAVRVFETGGEEFTWDVRTGSGKSMDAEARLLAASIGERLVTSQDRSQLGRIVYRETDGGGFEVVFELLSAGEVVASLRANEHASFEISDDGSTIVAVYQDIHRPQGSRLTIHDRSGEQIAEVPLPYIRSARLSADGRTIAVSTSEVLALLDRQGATLTRLEPVSDFRLSDDGRRLAGFEARSVALYGAGDLMGRVETVGVALDAAFDSTGTLVVIADSSFVYAFDIERSNLQMKRGLEAPSQQYRSVDVTRDGRMVVAGRIDVIESPGPDTDGELRAFVDLLDLEGDLRLSETLDLPLWNRQSPMVEFFDDDRRALVMTVDSLYVLEGLR